jgi:hypothetical protein
VEGDVLRVGGRGGLLDGKLSLATAATKC